MRFLQIKLLLWKNAVLIKRSPWITLLQIVLPLTLFLILVCVRLKIPPVSYNDHYYYAKPLPSAGYVPFIQSLLCDPISGRAELRNQRVSAFKTYPRASIYPVISLADAVVQLTDTYSQLSHTFTKLAHAGIFNKSVVEDYIKQPKEVQPEHSLAVQPEHSLAVQPEHSLAVQPEHSLVVQPEHSLVVQPEHSLVVQPEHSLVVQPEHSLAVQPEHSLAVQPEHSLVDTLKSLSNVSYWPHSDEDELKSKYDNDELMERLKRDDDGMMERMRRDISDYLTPAFDEVINDIDKVTPTQSDDDSAATDQSIMDKIKDYKKQTSDISGIQDIKNQISGRTNDLTPEDQRRVNKALETLAEEYFKHKYTETHHDPYTHTVKTLCRDPELLESDQIMELCKQLKLRDRQIIRTETISELIDQLKVMSDKIGRSNKVVIRDLKELQTVSRSGYMQGMFCGPSSTVQDVDARTMEVKLKLLEAFRDIKIPYTPNTGPVREIVKRMNSTFENAVALQVFSGEWLLSAPKLQRCISTLPNVTTVQIVRNTVLECYSRDRTLVPSHIQPWFDSVLVQDLEMRQALHILQYVRKDDYSNLLALHPMLNRSVNTAQLQDDIEMSKEMASQWLNATDNINFDVFVPFENETSLEQWVHDTDSSVWAGVVFENIEETLPAHINYTLRMNGKVVVGTGEVTQRFWSPNPMNSFYHRRYEWSGFVFLQDVVDRAIISYQSELSGLEMPDNVPGAYVQEMPYPCHTWDVYLKNLILVLPMFVCLSMIYSVCVIVRNIVNEKETRLREAMQQMGLSNTVHWLSWFITSMLQMSVTATIMVAMLYYGNILRHSNPLLLWLFFHAGILATISFCFLLSVFFSEAKLAAACSGLAYVVCYLPYTTISQSDGTAGNIGKTIVSLFSTSAFAMGTEYIIRFEEQGVGLQWHILTQGMFPTDEYNMLKCVGSLVFDAFLYMLLAIYIEGVFPGRYGVPKPWYFPIQVYWNRFPSPTTNQDIELPGYDCNANIEPSPNLSCGISITNLSKKYKGRSKPAVANLTLDLYENQILAFLGHNGAGKTTTMSMLTGLYPPTSGTATLYGKDIRTDMRLIRQQLGVCPQFNVLVDHLTVEEHLWFFASLKGTHPDKVREEVDLFVASVGMLDKRHFYANQLSGGMKRKLSVAMAFVGGSRVVILDEPTAGVDPWSRRCIWDLLAKHKHGRTILLSTHHMDEADLLGDRVAIIAHGQLLCCGSPLYLKARYGPGYYLNIEKDGPNMEESAEIEDVGVAQGFQKAMTTKLIKSIVPNASIHTQNEFEISYLLPWDAFKQGALPELFSTLDMSLGTLGIKCYGVMDSALEEVFLRVSEQFNVNEEEDKKCPLDKELIEEEEDEELLDTSELIPISKSDLPSSSNARQVKAQLLKRIHHTRRDICGLAFQIVLPAVFVCLAMIISLIKPSFDSSRTLPLSVSMFRKPYYVPFSANGSSPLTDLVGYPAGPWAPNIDNEVLALNNFTTPKHTESMAFPWNHYRSSPMGKCGNPEYPEIPSILQFKALEGYMLQNLTGWNLEKFLVQTNLRYVFQRYGAFSFGEENNDLRKFSPQSWSESNLIKWGVYNPYTAKAWHSYRGIHALPTYLSGVNNLILRSVLPKQWNNVSLYGLTVSSHPLKGDGSVTNQWELIDEQSYDLVVSIFVIIALGFVPASFVLFIVLEKSSSLFLLQSIAGARLVPYWVSNLIWDLVTFTVANGACYLVILAFHCPSFTSPDNLPAIAALFALYAWSITPMMYLFSKIFSESNNAYVIMMCLNTFFGVTTTLTTFLIDFLAPNDPGCIMINNFLKYFLLVLPNYGLGRGLMDLAANQFINDLRITYGYAALSPWRWQLLGRNLAFMAFMGPLFLFITALLSIPRPRTVKIIKDSYPVDEDEDVRAERQRTLFTRSYDNVLKTENLSKMYNNSLVVNRLAFSVAAGECFGLLGINGAGKTTTFKMLTGEIHPDGGDASLANYGLSKELVRARKELGYCTQTDALLGTLTAYETLALFARLRGIPESQIENLSRTIIRTMGLSPWASEPCQTYSGGNKRKLSTAITLIGEPKLILLDEPTAGMDPGARRSLWAVIHNQKSKGKALLITSHSMHECEELCGRLAIMVAGRLRCLGSPQHLKERYGNGYVMLLKLSPDFPDVIPVKVFIKQHLPEAVLKEEHYCSLRYEMKGGAVSVAYLFSTLHTAKPTLHLNDYSVHQTSLEQVFINFAQQQLIDQGDEALLMVDEERAPVGTLELTS